MDVVKKITTSLGRTGMPGWDLGGMPGKFRYSFSAEVEVTLKAAYG